ncbi:MAG: penicillin-binding transpeptidase domain-containing protein [Flavobacteriales bacterium]
MKYALPILICLFLAACESAPSRIDAHDSAMEKTIGHSSLQQNQWQDWLTQAGVEGVLLLADKDGVIRYASDTAKGGILVPPASTFKWVLALIALQTHVVTDVDSIMLRNGDQDSNPKGNSDQSLREGMRNSTNWIFRRLAQRIGDASLQRWMQEIKYPAQPVDAEVFWVEPDFNISPKEQIRLFVDLMRGNLPMDREPLQKTRSILCMEDTLGVKLFAKTGWCEPYGGNVGWYVGALVNAQDTSYFATCIQTKGEAPDNFSELRRSLTFRALKEVGWMSNELNF